MSENELLIPFVTDSQDFCHGWECGTICEKMERGQRLENYMMHEANIKQIELVARRYHYTVDFEVLSDGWAIMHAVQTGAN